ncbi:MAG TPA: DUF1178 family protein, partial [Acetobacteraceae bacterium]|nr:DUF1178 family protein [Acetobacteraceae bacterium]
QLRCSQGHGFDGWFKDSASFDAQAAGGLLTCPACADTRIERALMAPSLPARREPSPAPAPAPSSETPSGPSAMAVEGGALPDHVRAVLQRLRAEVERHCDYVGQDFAEEARRIRRGDSERRGIYGEASAEDAQSLAEEGIEVARIPWVPRADG